MAIKNFSLSRNNKKSFNNLLARGDLKRYSYMLGIFKKKKKEKTKDDFGVPMPPTPPSVGMLADDGLPHIPDDHPLDQPIHHPQTNPSTNFSQDPELQEIQNAINQAGKEDVSPSIGGLDDHGNAKKFQNGLDIPDISEQDDDAKTSENDTGFFEGDFIKQDVPEEIDDEIDSGEIPFKKEQYEQEEEADNGEAEEEENAEDEDYSSYTDSEISEGEEEMDLPEFPEKNIRAEQYKPYTLKSIPNPDELPRKPAKSFGIYVDLNDYEKIFKEIRYIDSFSKRCFRTVLKLRDISGNQNKLIDKFQSDLSYINERLSFMDTTFFEPNG